MNLDPNKTYTLKMTYDERLFLEREVYRLTQERFRESKVVERVPMHEALSLLIDEVQAYRSAECTCGALDHDEGPGRENSSAPDA